MKPTKIYVNVIDPPKMRQLKITDKNLFVFWLTIKESKFWITMRNGNEALAPISFSLDVYTQ